MQKDERDLLEVLKTELEFLEDGGYTQSPRTQWRARYIFEDSPSCMNYESKGKRVPCSACLLLELTPAEFRDTQIPCRHIPLSAKGDTLDSLYRYDDQRTIEETAGNWLRNSISRLQQERAETTANHKLGPAKVGNGLPARPLYQSILPKCANPGCAMNFEWTGGGKFFRFHPGTTLESPQGSASGHALISPAGAHGVRHYWLCETCCQIFTLSYEDSGKVIVKLLWTQPRAEVSDKRLSAKT